MNQRAKDEILAAVNEYNADGDEERLFDAIERRCKSVMYFRNPQIKVFNLIIELDNE